MKWGRKLIVAPPRWVHRDDDQTTTFRKTVAFGNWDLSRLRQPAIRARLRGRSGSAAPARNQTMKPGIHPEYHEINIVMTDGTQFKTRSCMGKAGDTLRLD